MKTTKKRDTLVSLVMAEAKALKKHATAEEIANLDIELLDPDSINRCIYGQMTGNCYNSRANQLIVKSCVRVYNADVNGVNLIRNAKLNGAPKLLEDSYKRKWTFHSPIEKFILLNRDKGQLLNNSILINYLKGITKKLVFV